MAAFLTALITVAAGLLGGVILVAALEANDRRKGGVR